MLSNFNQSISANAQSTVTVDGETKVMVYMNANIPSGGKMNINQAVQDETLYLANQETAAADLAEFTAKVVALAQTE